MLRFQNCAVKVKGVSLLAEQAELDFPTTLETIRSLGFSRALAEQTNGARSSKVSISYFIEVETDPNFVTITTLKSAAESNQVDLSNLAVQVEVGGITGQGFLESFDAQVVANDLVKANCTYSFFGNFSGEFSPYPAGSNPNQKNWSGLAHGWTTFLVGPNSRPPMHVQQFAYGFKANWQANYLLTGENPTDIIMIDGEETLSAQTDESLLLPSLGTGILDFLGSEQANLSFMRLQSVVNPEGFAYSIDLSDMTITESRMNVQAGNVASTQIQARRFF